MMRLRKAVECFVLAALISSPAWGSLPPQPGTINYVEGQAAIGTQSLAENSAGYSKLTAGQALSTDNGRAEVLLTPGIFLRIDSRTTVRMDSPGLANTILTLEKGRVLVEVAEILPSNNVRINADGADTRLLKAGLYDFDADHGMIRVFDGKADVQTAGRNIDLKSGYELTLNAAGKLKAEKFDKKANTDDFYRWASLRSSYLAEANVEAARKYASGAGAYPGWSGDGWYWDPGFDAYTFIPGDGIFFDPFGWGFYSPWFALGAPYFGYGYGFGNAGGYYRHFGPGYHPPYVAGRGSRFAGHAYNVGRGVGGGFSGAGFRGSGVSGFSRAGGGLSHGGFSGGSGGFHGSGGGFHGGGGGGFHGGGGHGR